MNFRDRNLYEIEEFLKKKKNIVQKEKKDDPLKKKSNNFNSPNYIRAIGHIRYKMVIVSERMISRTIFLVNWPPLVRLQKRGEENEWGGRFVEAFPTHFRIIIVHEDDA